MSLVFGTIENGIPIRIQDEIILDWHDRPIAAIACLANHVPVIHLLVAFDFTDQLGVRVFIPYDRQHDLSNVSILDSSFEEFSASVAGFVQKFQGNILCILENRTCVPIKHRIFDKKEVEALEFKPLDVDSTMNNADIDKWKNLF